MRTYIDSGTVRSWKGEGGQRIGLLLCDDDAPLEKSILQETSHKGVCIFATPPLYDDPEVHEVEDWFRDLPELVKVQGNRHAFIDYGNKDTAHRLGPNPVYADK